MSNVAARTLQTIKKAVVWYGCFIGLSISWLYYNSIYLNTFLIVLYMISLIIIIYYTLLLRYTLYFAIFIIPNILIYIYLYNIILYKLPLYHA